MLFVHEEHGLSVSKACTALRISRSMFLYKPTLRDGSLVITTLLELAERYPRYGFAKYFAVLRREGYTWNHKRVYRIYRQLQLNMRRKGKRRLAWLPFGNFRLKMEKTAKVRSSRPTPEIIVIIVHNLHKTLCLKYPCVGTVCRVPTRLTMPKL